MYAEIITVLTTPTILLRGRNGATGYLASGLIANNTGATIYLGGPTVSVATGFPWVAGSPPIGADLLGADEILYGIANGTSATPVNLLRRGGTTV